MMCVGALVFVAAVRQYEAWPDARRPVVHADVVPGVSPNDPVVRFQIGQR